VVVRTLVPTCTSPEPLPIATWYSSYDVGLPALTRVPLAGNEASWPVDDIPTKVKGDEVAVMFQPALDPGRSET
jgi:hypothetical protein